MIILFSEYKKNDNYNKIKRLLDDLLVDYFLQNIGKKSLIIVRGKISEETLMKLKNCVKIEKIFENEKEFLLTSSNSKKKEKDFWLSRYKWKKNAILLSGGPCAIEEEKSLEIVAKTVKRVGGLILRGGSFKPRTSPYSFQGLGERGLKIHRKVADKYGLLMMSEVLDRQDLPMVNEYADIIQIGSRNMQNFSLLKAVGRIDKPVLLKRNFGSTREEFLLAAEYILSEGNEKVILCERGVRGFEPAGKNIFDPVSLEKLKEMTWLRVVVDPSHSAGESKYVGAIAKSALVSGADGLIIETHSNPKNALSDGQQALTLKEFENLVFELKKICAIIGKEFFNVENF